MGAPAIVVEQAGPIEAFGRSRRLVRGDAWPVFGTLVVVLLIVIAIGVVLGVIATPIGYVYHELIIARQRNCERPRRRLPGSERRLERLAIGKRCRRQVLGPHRLDVKQLGDVHHRVSVSV